MSDKASEVSSVDITSNVSDEYDSHGGLIIDLKTLKKRKKEKKTRSKKQKKKRNIRKTHKNDQPISEKFMGRISANKNLKSRYDNNTDIISFVDPKVSNTTDYASWTNPFDVIDTDSWEGASSTSSDGKTTGVDETDGMFNM